MALASGAALLLGIGLSLSATTAEAGPCAPGKFPASGQTTAYTADINDGTASNPVSVPDDGTVQAGAALRYKDNGNGTITDKNTGLVWEMKCSSCGGLHDKTNTYLWSTSSATDTIWDWLADVNTEGGTGFAGKSDWRIPNVKELQSIVDYGRCDATLGGACADQAAIDPIFGPTAASFYWSSTTVASFPGSAWFVDFSDGGVGGGGTSGIVHVRAVRGGCVD